MDFDGATLEPSDILRLKGQLKSVYDIMSDGRYRTLEEIVNDAKQHFDTVMKTQSASARLRDLRKPKFGGYQVLRRRAGEGVFEYALVIPKVANAAA